MQKARRDRERTGTQNRLLRTDLLRLTIQCSYVMQRARKDKKHTTQNKFWHTDIVEFMVFLCLSGKHRAEKWEHHNLHLAILRGSRTYMVNAKQLRNDPNSTVCRTSARCVTVGKLSFHGPTSEKTSQHQSASLITAQALQY
eukprot:1158872-Pelagomonas_calceolata.AAC.3